MLFIMKKEPGFKVKTPLRYDIRHQEIIQSDNTPVVKLYFNTDFTNDQEVKKGLGQLITKLLNASLESI